MLYHLRQVYEGPRTTAHQRVGVVGLLTWICVFALVWEGGGQAACRAGDESIREEFLENEFDRDEWRMDKVPPEVATVEITNESLHITALPTAKGKPGFRMSSKFKLEGDFDVRIDYDLENLPNPANEFVNLELVLSGPEGMVHLTRGNHQGTGHCYVVFYNPRKDSDKKSRWLHWPTQDMKGTLRAERVGKELTLSCAQRGESDFRVLTTIPYGLATIERVAFGPSVVGDVDQPVAVRLDNIQVEMSPATRTSPVSFFGRASWILLGILVFVGACLAIYLSSTRSSEQPPQPT